MMDLNDFKLPPLEEILERNDNSAKSGDKICSSLKRNSGEIASPWYREVCPILKKKTGDGEIKVNGEKVVCGYFGTIKTCDRGIYSRCRNSKNDSDGCYFSDLRPYDEY